MHKLHPDPTPSEAEYWKKNVRLVLSLLAIWFVVSYGAGILFVDQLDRFRLPGTGFPLGFWFAQQGSIYVFVVLIFFYVWRMNRLDREFGVGEDGPAGPTPGGGASKPEGETGAGGRTPDSGPNGESRRGPGGEARP